MFSESPPLKRKNSDRPPFDWKPDVARLVVCRGFSGGAGFRWCSEGLALAGLLGVVGSGKFGKLLRSDPECLVWVVSGVSVV